MNYSKKFMRITELLSIANSTKWHGSNFRQYQGVQLWAEKLQGTRVPGDKLPQESQTIDTKIASRFSKSSYNIVSHLTCQQDNDLPHTISITSSGTSRTSSSSKRIPMNVGAFLIFPMLVYHVRYMGILPAQTKLAGSHSARARLL
eukprot:947752-Rhodomonas_salina.1